MTFTQLFTDNFSRSNASSLGNGWLDPGAKGSIQSDVAVLATGGSNYSGSGVVYRPTSDGNPRDGQVVAVIGAGIGSTTNCILFTRLQQSNTANSGYIAGVGGGAMTVYAVINGALNQIGSGVTISPTYNNAHAYTLTLSAVGANPTTLVATLVDNTTSATVASFTGTDSNASLQSVTSGTFGICANSGSGNVPITSFTTYAATATAISVSGPSAGASGSVSGTFTASVNGSLGSNVILTPSDGGAGGTFAPNTVTFTAGSSPANQTFTYTPGSAGTDTLSFTNNGSLTNPSNITYTATSAISILPNNAAFNYSPGNWDVTSTRALTINAGAYFGIMFSGSSVALNFDISTMSTPTSEIYYRIDGYEAQAPLTRAYLSGSVIAVTMPSDTSNYNWHTLEVITKVTDGNGANRWNTPSATAVKFTGLTLANGATVAQPGIAANGSVLFFGDSITEGVRTVNYSLANSCDNQDATTSWAYLQRYLLGVEVGVIGFSSSGLTVASTPGNVPSLINSYAYIMQGIARNMSIANLKLIVLNEGTNDSGASASSVTSALTAVLNGMLTAYPGIPIAVMRPFNGSQATALQAGIAGCSNPTLVHWVDTTGFLNTTYGIDSSNLHPSGANNLGMIAPKVAAALRPLLIASSSGARSYSFS